MESGRRSWCSQRRSSAGSARWDRRRCRREDAGRESRDCLRLAVGADAAQDHDLVAMRVSEEEIAVGSGADEARLLEVSGCVELDLEAGGSLGPCAIGPRDEIRAVIDRLGFPGLGQVGDGDLAADAGMLLGVVGEGGWSGDGLVRVAADGSGLSIRSDRRGGNDSGEQERQGCERAEDSGVSSSHVQSSPKAAVMVG